MCTFARVSAAAGNIFWATTTRPSASSTRFSRLPAFEADAPRTSSKKERKKERKNKKDRKSIRAIGKTTCSFFFFFSCVFFSFFFGSQPKKKRASPTNQGTRLALTESVSLLNKLTLIAEVYLVATICPHWYLLLPNCLTSVCFKVDLISPISS